MLPRCHGHGGRVQGDSSGYSRSTTSRDLEPRTCGTPTRTSIEISLVTALLGGLFGLLLAYAAIRDGTPRWIRSAFATFSGVAANFGGIPLAFAFIATLGTIGIVTQFLTNVFGFNLYDHGFTLFGKTGVELVYLYFQIPLMILVIAPAIDGVRAGVARGVRRTSVRSSFQYWRHIGLPVLMPVAPRRGHPALRQRVRGLRDRVRASRPEALPARADPDRHRLVRERPVEPARGAGARLRDVRRPRRDDAVLRPAAAHERRGGRGEETGRALCCRVAQSRCARTS